MIEDKAYNKLAKQGKFEDQIKDPNKVMLANIEAKIQTSAKAKGITLSQERITELALRVIDKNNKATNCSQLETPTYNKLTQKGAFSDQIKDTASVEQANREAKIEAYAKTKGITLSKEKITELALKLRDREEKASLNSQLEEPTYNKLAKKGKFEDQIKNTADVANENAISLAGKKKETRKMLATMNTSLGENTGFQALKFPDSPKI